MAMLSDINTLPGAEVERSASDRNVQRNAVDHGFDMGGHIVWTLDLVDPSGIGRRHAVECGEQIAPNVGVGVFLDDERGGGMTEKKRETAVGRLAVLQKSPDLAGNLKEPFARCLDRKDRGSDGFRTCRADRGKGGAHLPSALVQYLLLRAND